MLDKKSPIIVQIYFWIMLILILGDLETLPWWFLSTILCNSNQPLIFDCFTIPDHWLALIAIRGLLLVFFTWFFCFNFNWQKYNSNWFKLQVIWCKGKHVLKILIQSPLKSWFNLNWFLKQTTWKRFIITFCASYFWVLFEINPKLACPSPFWNLININ